MKFLGSKITAAFLYESRKEQLDHIKLMRSLGWSIEDDGNFLLPLYIKYSKISDIPIDTPVSHS